MTKTSFTVGNVSRRSPLTRSPNAAIKIGRFLTRRTAIVELICGVHIMLFIYTGLNKIIDIESFKFEIGRSPFIQNMNSFIAYTLPVGEILLALALIIKRTRLLGLYLSFTLMALFTGYVWLMLNYAFDLPCSCGGIISKLSWHDHLIFNAVFTTLGISGVILQSKISQDAKKKTTSQSLS